MNRSRLLKYALLSFTVALLFNNGQGFKTAWSAITKPFHADGGVQFAPQASNTIASGQPGIYYDNASPPRPHSYDGTTDSLLSTGTGAAAVVYNLTGGTTSTLADAPWNVLVGVSGSTTVPVNPTCTPGHIVDIMVGAGATYVKLTGSLTWNGNPLPLNVNTSGAGRAVCDASGTNVVMLDHLSQARASGLYPLRANNLSDLANTATALTNLIGGSPSTGNQLTYNGTSWVAASGSASNFVSLRSFSNYNVGGGGSITMTAPNVSTATGGGQLRMYATSYCSGTATFYCEKLVAMDLTSGVWSPRAEVYSQGNNCGGGAIGASTGSATTVVISMGGWGGGCSVSVGAELAVGH